MKNFSERDRVSMDMAKCKLSLANFEPQVKQTTSSESWISHSTSESNSNWCFAKPESSMLKYFHRSLQQYSLKSLGTSIFTNKWIVFSTIPAIPQVIMLIYAVMVMMFRNWIVCPFWESVFYTDTTVVPDKGALLIQVSCSNPEFQSRM